MWRTGPAAPLGATPLQDGGTRFVVWAPRPERVEVVLDDGDRVVELADAGDGHRAATVADVAAGATYRYRLHGPDGVTVDHPDPASRWQPRGVHGPSAVDDPDAHAWRDEGWRAPARHELVLYELHVGTFTSAGTFDAAAARLPDLAQDGITAVELLPVNQFPGARNWGYDGVLPYAVQDSYGGPDGLRRFVDAAHEAGVAVLLDVVYNHLGPEGNVLRDFGPYFTDRYGTPWGEALNVDGPGSDGVRRFVVENAVRWVTEFHLDGLRLDAVHAIHDESATPVLADLGHAVHAAAARARRTVHVIAESDLNDARFVRAPQVGGLGLDGVWNDDVHHALHALVTGEDDGYYADYGTVQDLVRAVRDRYAYAGRHSAYRGRFHGAPARDVDHDRFVVCVQNHDQVGNRAQGERLSTLVDHERRKLAAAVLLLSPFTPLLFMGEEYGEPAPFPYFVDHTDPDLLEAVRVGRREEFAGFAWDEVPDPAAAATFESAVLDWDLREQGEHATTLALYRELLRLRRTLTTVADPAAEEPAADEPAPGVLRLVTSSPEERCVLLAAFGDRAEVALPDGDWEVLLDTAAPRWGGPSTDERGTVRASVEVTGGSAVLLRGPAPSDAA